MLLVFSFALVSLVLVFILSLEEINPFRPKALPMLDQIELYRAQSEENRDDDSGNVPLAA